MVFLNGWKVGTRLLLLCAAFVLGLLLYAGLAYNTRQIVQIDGPLYREIMRNQDLVGDVLPSRQYLGEAYLVAYQMAAETDRGQLDELVRRSRLIRQQYDEGHAVWLGSSLDLALKDALVVKSYEPAKRFFAIQEAQLIPAVRAGKRADALVLLDGALKQAYGEHRRAIDNVVRLAQAARVAKLHEARETIRDRTVQLMVLAGVIVAVVGVGLGFLVTRSITHTLRDTANALSSTSIELASTIEQHERTAMSQSAAVNETTTTMDELDASFTQAGDMVTTAAERAEQSLAVANRGIQTVRQTLDGMVGLKEKVGTIAEQILTLSEQTGQISTITSQVSDLAIQTNMLALNAAVEAARAGEHGRGFAVVAAEIRKLADGSRKSAERIDALVDQIQKATNATVMATEEGTKTVEQGIRLAQKTVEAFNEVKDASNTASEAAHQMRLSVPQQVTAVKQVLASMDSLNTGARETADGIGQTRLVSENLREAAFALKAIVESMIEDLELRTLFQAESEEHLQSLETGLLHLEAEPRDVASLETVFRAAHSLKGGARMLGVVGLESLAHHFEDELGAARHGHKVLSAEGVQRLYRGLDAMRGLAREAVTGEPVQVDLARVLLELRGELSPGPAPEPSPPLSGAGTAEAGKARSGGNGTDRRQRAAPVAVLPAVGAGPAAPTGDGAPGEIRVAESVPVGPDSPEDSASSAPADAFKIATIRVEPQRLDALMARVGELAVTTTRVRRGLAAVDDLGVLWEEWSRDSAAARLLPGSREGDAGARSGNSLARLHEREEARLAWLGRVLGRLQRAAGEDVTRLGFVANELEESIRGLRLLPVATIFNLFPRLVRDLAREQGKEVQLVTEGGETTADKRLLEELKDPLMHMIRNAIDHGIEPPEERERLGKPRVATLALRAHQSATHVVIEVADDGRGLDPEAIRRTAQQRRLGRVEDLQSMRPEQLHALIFAPGFSTSSLITDVSGRGVGLDVVRANVERLNGTIQVESVPGGGSTFRIQTRITLATTHVLLVRAGAPGTQWPYALPVEFVQEALLVAPEEVFSIEGRPAIRIAGQSISVARLADLLELRSGPAKRENQESLGRGGQRLPCILLSVHQERFGLFVDALLDEQEVMFKPLGGLLKRVRNVSGATILGTGEACMILNPADLLKTMRGAESAAAREEPAGAEERRKLVLLAEDSLTTRTQEKRILESAGYEVVTAVDGADAFSKLSTRPFDAVVSDIEMPNMDGLALAARIREDPQYRELPILLVTSLASEEDRRRGIEVGANAYITKGTFEQKLLLDTLKRLV